MKIFKITGLTLLLAVFTVGTTNAQLGGLLNKVKNKIVDKALGNESSDNQALNKSAGSEPACACDDAMVAFAFDKGYDVNITEISVTIKDGDILLFAKDTQKYFVKKSNSDSPEGPFEENDPQVTRFFDSRDVESNGTAYSVSYPGIISREGEKYIISLGGQKYGPYAIIQSFAVNQSKTKFVANVTADVMFSESEQKELENAEHKSQAEQMALAMKMQEKMQQRMMNSGGVLDIQPKIVSNVPGVGDTPILFGQISSKMKYDDLVWIEPDKVTDLKGNTLLNIDRQKMNVSDDNFWISSDGKRWATYSYGRMLFSDGSECADVFAPYLIVQNGKPALAYLYFSPKNNAIMQCAVPF